MVLVKELRKQAKEKSFKGYYSLSKENLDRVLAGEKAIKNLKKNQASKSIQSDFPLRQNCQLKQIIDFMIIGSEKNIDIVYDGDSQFNVKTGEMMRMEMEYSRFKTMNSEYIKVRYWLTNI